jgi:hypothetical protein
MRLGPLQTPEWYCCVIRDEMNGLPAGGRFWVARIKIGRWSRVPHAKTGSFPCVPLLFLQRLSVYIWS